MLPGMHCEDFCHPCCLYSWQLPSCLYKDTTAAPEMCRCKYLRNPPESYHHNSALPRQITSVFSLYIIRKNSYLISRLQSEKKNCRLPAELARVFGPFQLRPRQHHTPLCSPRDDNLHIGHAKSPFSDFSRSLAKTTRNWPLNQIQVVRLSFMIRHFASSPLPIQPGQYGRIQIRIAGPAGNRLWH